MNPSLSRTAPRAHVSPGCPVCHGAGVLPSMQVAGMTNPCPRCQLGLQRPNEPAPEPAQVSPPGFPLAYDDLDDAPTSGGLVLLLGVALGAIGTVMLGLLVLGASRVFGG